MNDYRDAVDKRPSNPKPRQYYNGRGRPADFKCPCEWRRTYNKSYVCYGVWCDDAGIDFSGETP